MAEFLVKTRGGMSAQGKSRTYFCCHPEDFSRYFDKICEDIFLSQDTAIYYTEDMSEPLDEVNFEVDLGRMSLFVVPVTLRLMREENRAMQTDLAYAKEHNIPILPIMMERGIDEVYSRPENFGERQYIDPFATDTTAISYEEKLKKFLSITLISDETAKRVRAAFDAYVFLSYRKKDRKYANELMKLIHRIPACRDIAIWYDEFLTPGESFTENIRRAMDKSKLFTLLVTPNLLEDGNFVMAEEYPRAKEAEMDILPAEMESTDHSQLFVKFDGIPEPISTDTELFAETFLETLHGIAIRANDSDPEHNFLIGLAYLDGIDVEVDTERALELITSSAEAELPEAMIMLCGMYRSGVKVTPDMRKVLKWSIRIADYYTKTYGEEDENSMLWLANLGTAYSGTGDLASSISVAERVYEIRKRVSGEDHELTLLAVQNLLNSRMLTCTTTDEYAAILPELSELCDRMIRVLGEESVYTCIALSNLAFCYSVCGKYEKAIEIQKKVYSYQCRSLGEDNMWSLNTMNNLATSYLQFEMVEESRETLERAYELACKKHGEVSAVTLNILENLSTVYSHLEDCQKSLEMGRRSYEIACLIYGEEHPTTLQILMNLGISYANAEDFENSCEALKQAVELSHKLNGENHNRNVIVLNNLGQVYNLFGYKREELQVYERVFNEATAIHGEGEENALEILALLIKEYGELGDLENKLRLEERQYAIFRKCYGKRKKQTVKALESLAETCALLKDYKKAIDYYDRLYNIKRKSLGDGDVHTLDTLITLANLYGKIGENEKKAELGEKVISYYRSKYDHDCKFDHMWSACMYLSYLADSYYDLGYYDEALPLYEELCELSKKHRGKDEWYVLSSMDRLAYIHTFKGRYEIALDLFERVLEMRKKIHPDQIDRIETTTKNIEYVRSKIKK